ncbi:MAG: hypothetical protein ACRCTE_13365 [Cellulosilyticaceae bacterium]
MDTPTAGQTFTLDYLGKYYFYDIESFKSQNPNAEMILKQIKEYSRYQEGDHAFTKTKFGHISEGYTLKGVEVVIPPHADYLLIGGEKRHLDLAFKMECSKLEDHVRIGTRLIEDGQSISCLLYINHTQAQDFLNCLEQIKANQPH